MSGTACRVVSRGAAEPVGDVGGRLLGVLVGEELQGVGGTPGLGESSRSPQQLLCGGEDKLGLGDRLGGIIKPDGVPGQVSHFARLVGHRELGPVHRNARTKKSAVIATAVVRTSARSMADGSLRTR